MQLPVDTRFYTIQTNSPPLHLMHRCCYLLQRQCRSICCWGGSHRAADQPWRGCGMLWWPGWVLWRGAAAFGQWRTGSYHTAQDHVREKCSTWRFLIITYFLHVICVVLGIICDHVLISFKKKCSNYWSTTSISLAVFMSSQILINLEFPLASC